MIIHRLYCESRRAIDSELSDALNSIAQTAEEKEYLENKCIPSLRDFGLELEAAYAAGDLETVNDVHSALVLPPEVGIDIAKAMEEIDEDLRGPIYL